jgi:hypothetical protein
MLNAVMPSVAFFCYAECRCDECRHAKCRGAIKVQVQEKQNGAINFKKLSLHLQGACIIKLFTAVIVAIS